MFKIRRIHGASNPEDVTALSSVLDIYQKAFSYYPLYAQQIADFLKFSSDYDFEIVLLVAEGRKNRIQGFSLSF